jgi:alpha-mannosidase
VRKPYYEIPYEHKECAEFLASEDYSKAKGDWPALNWVDYSDSRGGLAIANDGTPGHQLTAGDIIISLLRSPTRRADGAMVPQEGALENGTHEYNFLFRAHIPGETGKAVELGEILNQPPVTVFDSAKDKIEPSNSSLIYWHQNNVALSSLHPGKNGTIILRLFESTGKCSKVKLFSDICGFELKETDVHGNELRSLPGNEFELKPFEIKTLGINFDEQNYRRIF